MVQQSPVQENGLGMVMHMHKISINIHKTQIRVPYIKPRLTAKALSNNITCVNKTHTVMPVMMID